MTEDNNISRAREMVSKYNEVLVPFFNSVMAARNESYASGGFRSPIKIKRRIYENKICFFIYSFINILE
jgi:hypothetical protein